MSDEEIQKINKYNIKRRIKQSKMKRKVRHTQRRIQVFRIFLRICLLAFLIFIARVIVYMPQWRLPADALSSFNNPSLQISNNKIVPSYKILSAVRQIEIPNKPIFLIKTDNIKESILQFDPIQDVYVRRFWFPARLEIIIKERVPSIMIAPNEKVPPIAYFSKDGKLIGHEYLPLKANYNTVKVLTYGTANDDYRKWNIQKQNFIKKLTKTVEMYSNEPVEYIDLRSPNDVYVKLKTVKLRLGSVDEASYDKIATRLSQLPSLLPQVRLLDKKIQYLDLRWDKVYYIKLDE